MKKTVVISAWFLLTAAAAWAQTSCSAGGSFASYCGSDAICFGLPWCEEESHLANCDTCGSQTDRQSCTSTVSRHYLDCLGVCDRQTACDPLSDPFCGFAPTKGDLRAHEPAPDRARDLAPRRVLLRRLDLRGLLLPRALIFLKGGDASAG